MPSCYSRHAYVERSNELIISELPVYNHARHRRNTFFHWPNDLVSVRELAASGFVHVQDTKLDSTDTVECVFCHVRISDWKEDMVPDDVHIKKSIYCKFMQGSNNVQNVPDMMAAFGDESPCLLPNGCQRRGCRYSEFAVKDKRHKTFLTWPHTNHITAETMADHYLFYAGGRDTVCCYSCGTVMSEWTLDESIWERHARLAPRCKLLLQVKGHTWVEKILQGDNRQTTVLIAQANEQVIDRVLGSQMEHPVIQDVLQMKNPEYKRKEVRDTLIHNIKYGLPSPTRRADLIKAIIKRREEKRQEIRNGAAVVLPTVLPADANIVPDVSEFVGSNTVRPPLPSQLQTEDGIELTTPEEAFSSDSEYSPLQSLNLEDWLPWSDEE